MFAHGFAAHSVWASGQKSPPSQEGMSRRHGRAESPAPTTKEDGQRACRGRCPHRPVRYHRIRRRVSRFGRAFCRADVGIGPYTFPEGFAQFKASPFKGRCRAQRGGEVGRAESPAPTGCIQKTGPQTGMRFAAWSAALSFIIKYDNRGRCPRNGRPSCGSRRG